MTEKIPLKPSFEEEFPNSGVDWPEHIERQVDRGEITPRMADIRSKIAAPVKTHVTVETATPQLDEVLPDHPVVTEVDQLTEQSKALAEQRGGHPNDYDWRYR